MTEQARFPRVIEHKGWLYYYYAGPFMAHYRADDLIESCFADGRFSESDAPIVLRNTVYIRA